jgi:hypothetical protein
MTLGRKFWILHSAKLGLLINKKWLFLTFIHLEFPK